MEISVRKSSLGVLLATVLLFLCMLYSQYFITKITGEKNITNTGFYLSRFFIWGVLILIFMYSKFIEKKPFLLWKERKYSFKFSVIAIISVYFIAIASAGISNTIVHSITHEKLSEKLLFINSFFKNSYLLLIFTCITAGITEELLMRGYLQPRISKITHQPWLGIFLSSFIFGILHSSYGTIGQIVGPLIMGIVFSLFYYKHRSILLLIIVHFLIDFISLNILFLVDIEKHINAILL